MNMHPHLEGKLCYIWRTSKWQVVFTLLALAIAIIMYSLQYEPFLPQWNNWISMYVSVTTLFLAAFIWYNEKQQDWENGLPKKLNITYIYNNEMYAHVLNAPLAGEGDIRSWGQSIGQTILNKRTGIDFSGFKIAGHPELKNNMMIYHLTVYLHNPIEGIDEGSQFEFDEEGKIKSNK